MLELILFGLAFGGFSVLMFFIGKGIGYTYGIEKGKFWEHEYRVEKHMTATYKGLADRRSDALYEYEKALGDIDVADITKIKAKNKKFKQTKRDIIALIEADDKASWDKLEEIKDMINA